MMRINKFMSESGKSSRRGADKLVEEGRITINGELAVMGSKVEPGDVVFFDGEEVSISTDYVYLVLNKPIGITSTTERHIKGNVIDYVNHEQRIFHIGRLDKDSEGLLLLTNDGDIVNEILREENGHDKEYIVSVDRLISEDFLYDMANGVEILDTVTKPCKVEQLSDFAFKITLQQGLNRQIRRMCNALGYSVYGLQRIRIMNIHLENLPLGQWRELTTDERQEMFRLLDYSPKSW